MTIKERLAFELGLQKDFSNYMDDTKTDLFARVNGVAAKAGATGWQFVGYTRLERFYRGDQWDHNEPPGASQRTDNYCAVIIDNTSSLIFDDKPEINCPVDDPTDELLEIKAEHKESLLWRVWEDNDFQTEFDEWAKVSSLYGDGFLVGPYMEKVDDDGFPLASDAKGGSWKICFHHVENPGSIRPIYLDNNFKQLYGYIDETPMSLRKGQSLYGEVAKKRGVVLVDELTTATPNRMDPDTRTKVLKIQIYWTANVKAVFINQKLLDYSIHNWGFVPLEQIKNTYVPNYPYGKSDIEDVLDPQLSHNRTNNDLANLLRWLSTVNMWGKNLEGMEALVAGLSKIYSLPEDGELHTFEKPGDAYITNTYSQQRRSAIIDISGLSESSLSSSQLSVSSGRALAMAFQGTIRKLNPRLKRFAVALQHLNRNILKLYEIYYPETKLIIGGDYRSKVYMSATILRNIVDTINKFQAGLVSLDTAQREAGVSQPKMEQKMMKKDLSDPILGPQVARQPSLLPRLTEGENQPGQNPMPGPGQSPVAGQAGAIAANNQQASGAAPVPVNQ